LGSQLESPHMEWYLLFSKVFMDVSCAVGLKVCMNALPSLYTARACRFGKGRGKISALTVNKSNVNAIKLYESLGFKHVDNMLVYMKSRKFSGDENE